jgi:hypothetical protein
MTLLSRWAALVRAVRKQLQTIALLALAHFDYERAGVSQFVSHFRLHPFALAVNLQDALDASASRTRSSFPRTLWLHVEATVRVVEEASPTWAFYLDPGNTTPCYAMTRWTDCNPVGMRTASGLGHGVAAAALAPSVCA